MNPRFDQYAAIWNVSIDRMIETASSIVGFGRQGSTPVVLKIVRQENDEWHSGNVLRAFDGQCAARLLECDPGALLIEELSPGYALTTVADKSDDEAMDILAHTIAGMRIVTTDLATYATVEDWGRAFESTYDAAQSVIERELLDEARERYAQLCNTQTDRRLLHGDLQHYNVLYDSSRGWAAIDPKGVVGETAYETGAALRNPWDSHVAHQTSNAERRIARLARITGCDEERIAAWGFSQAVLSALWTVEDGNDRASPTHALAVARAIRPLL